MRHAGSKPRTLKFERACLSSALDSFGPELLAFCREAPCVALVRWRLHADLDLVDVTLLQTAVLNFPPRISSIMDERQRLQSPDIQQRTAAAEALCQMGPDAAFAAVELVSACADDDTVRDAAVAALEELGPPTPEVLPSLVTLVSSSDPLVAYWAITLLGRAGVAAKFSQDELASVLTTSSVISLRERAAWSLSKIDASSESAIQALEYAAGSSEARLSRLAKAALKQAPA